MLSTSLRRSILPAVIALAVSGCAIPASEAPAPAPAASAVPDAAAEAAAPVSPARVGEVVAETGELDGALFRIDIPADWNGDLVVYTHGYEPVGSPREDELAQDDFVRAFLVKGYAVAQSLYSQQGWAVAEGIADSERLRGEFVARHGQPRNTLLVGYSMGAHIALALLEKHPENYAGVLALCGINAPAAEVFPDAVLAPLAAFDHAYPGTMGLAAGGLADPESPPFIDPSVFETALQGDEAKATLLAARFEIPRAELAGGLMLRYFALRELMQRAGGFPVDNRATVYSGLGDDAAFNAGVRRYTDDPAAMAYVAANAALTGAAAKPVVVMSNFDDPTVPSVVSGRYAELAEAAGHGGNVLTLPTVGHGHCAFDAADEARALAVLAEWVGTGVRPAAP